jgi:CheY-like chemotaxis protein
VAEDSPTQARHLAQLLAQDRDCPAHVRVAADGTAALRAAREHLPHLVISDIAMPGMDGYGLCRALEDDPRLAAVPVKLDRSFVHELETDADDLAIARAVIAMAHGLRLSVVAEGVDTAGQLELLAGLGCDIVQGWLFSRAVPASQFAGLLAQGPVRSRCRRS